MYLFRCICFPGITLTNHPMNRTSASLSLDYLWVSQENQPSGCCMTWREQWRITLFVIVSVKSWFNLFISARLPLRPQAPRHRCGHRHLHHRGHVFCASQLRGVPRGGEVDQGEAPAVCQRLWPCHLLAGQLHLGHGGRRQTACTWWTVTPGYSGRCFVWTPSCHSCLFPAQLPGAGHMLCHHFVCVRPASLHLPNQLPSSPVSIPSLWVRHYFDFSCLFF